MEVSYPDGVASIPPQKLPYFSLPYDAPLEDFVPPAPLAVGIVQLVAAPDGRILGYALRLGSSSYPHLKLRVQPVDRDDGQVWVFMVDTHDAFSRESWKPPDNHPDAPRWRALQHSNRLLKEQVEAAFERNGITTMNSLLRADLD